MEVPTAKKREQFREKYYRSVESKITRKLNEWLKDETIKPSFKQFIRECVWPKKSLCPLAFMRTLSVLEIAFEESKAKPDRVIDGGGEEDSEREGDEREKDEREEDETEKGDS